MLGSMPNQSVGSNDYPFVTTFPASQPWDAPDPLPVMRREMKLLLIEIGQLRTEVEQLRAKEEEAQNVKEFLYLVIESRDQWQREAQRLRALMAKVPPWLLFCGRCLDAFKASREGSEGLDLHQSPSQCPLAAFVPPPYWYSNPNPAMLDLAIAKQPQSAGVAP